MCLANDSTVVILRLRDKYVEELSFMSAYTDTSVLQLFFF